MKRQGEMVLEIEAVVARRLTWRLVPFLFLLYIVAYLDRINVGFGALRMRQQLAFTDAVYGLGAGMVFLAQLFFQVAIHFAPQPVGGAAWNFMLVICLVVFLGAAVLVRGPRRCVR